MAIVLYELMRKFCKENGVSQREVVEFAMIEFFRKYGFSQQVEEYLFD